MQSTGIDILPTGADSKSAAAFSDPCIDKSAEVFIAAFRTAPEIMQLMKDVARHLDRAPDPSAGRMRLFDMDAQKIAVAICGDGIEELRLIYGKEKQGKSGVWKLSQSIGRGPDGIR